ncbi:MAG TPA: hypothetical protein VMI34_13885 [Candidatus Bathyarchaeia archaeon]|nr:hypothetical protein [Candidatus Bathyarchaeia archaeon]
MHADPNGEGGQRRIPVIGKPFRVLCGFMAVLLTVLALFSLAGGPFMGVLMSAAMAALFAKAARYRGTIAPNARPSEATSRRARNAGFLGLTCLFFGYGFASAARPEEDLLKLVAGLIWIAGVVLICVPLYLRYFQGKAESNDVEE